VIAPASAACVQAGASAAAGRGGTIKIIYDPSWARLPRIKPPEER
jgi:hypothetical protein